MPSRWCEVRGGRRHRYPRAQRRWRSCPAVRPTCSEGAGALAEGGRRPSGAGRGLLLAERGSWSA
eukprot:14831546-Alexandrium_andersonii.AAC.1